MAGPVEWRRQRLPAFRRQADQLTTAAGQQAAAGHVWVLAVRWAAVWNRCALDVVACEGKGKTQRRPSVGAAAAARAAGARRQWGSDWRRRSGGPRWRAPSLIATPQRPRRTQRPGDAGPHRHQGQGEQQGCPEQPHCAQRDADTVAGAGRGSRCRRSGQLLFKLRCGWETGALGCW